MVLEFRWQHLVDSVCFLKSKFSQTFTDFWRCDRVKWKLLFVSVKFFSLFYTKSFIGCRVWSSVVAIIGEKLTKSIGDGFSIWYFFFVYFECRTSKFWFRFGGKYTFQCSPESSSFSGVFIQQVFVVLFGSFNKVINFVSLTFVFLVVFGCFRSL